MTDRKPDESDSSDGEYVDPDLPNDAKPKNDGAPALSPEELDIADSEYVEPLDDNGRYVVSSGSSPPSVPDSLKGGRSDGSGGIDNEMSKDAQSGQFGSDGRSRETIRSPEAARTLLAEELARSNARYGVDIVGRFDGNTVRHRTASDDVIATFENLVQWYARHVTDGTPADEVLEILLREADLVETETPNLAKLLERHGLDRSDSIAELVAAIREESTQG